MIQQLLQLYITYSGKLLMKGKKHYTGEFYFHYGISLQFYPFLAERFHIIMLGLKDGLHYLNGGLSPCIHQEKISVGIHAQNKQIRWKWPLGCFGIGYF